jgi:hypothetical protein
MPVYALRLAFRLAFKSISALPDESHFSDGPDAVADIFPLAVTSTTSTTSTSR